MARKIPGLERVLDAPALAAVAYGEIGSSLYFALGVVAIYALGLTPWVLLAVGAVFIVVALSYAEGAAALPEGGGAAAFVRRAFNDPAGFATGWVLFLDYLIVIALAALFVPHYVGTAFEWEAITDGPWDVAAGAGIVVAVAAFRLVRRSVLYRAALVLAGLALVGQLALVVLGFAFAFSTGALGEGIDLGTAPSWSSIAFALALATLAYTGLETVANLAAETREPGRSLPRSLFTAIGAVVVVTTLVAVVGVSASPPFPDPGAPDGLANGLGAAWARAPLVGIAAAFGGDLPDAAVDALRIFVGATGAVVLLAAISTSISGAGRLAYALARRNMLPRRFGRLNRRTLIAPPTILSAAALAIGLLVAGAVNGQPLRFLASVYSFGVLLAFAAAQLAVLRLRATEPDLERPFRVPGNVRVRGVSLPVAALVGLPLTLALWIAAIATHDAARIAGPVWLVLGAAVYVAVRRTEREGVLERVEPAAGDLVAGPEGIYRRILVPLKLGEIGDEVLATALRLAGEHQARVDVVHVIKVPMDFPLDRELPEAEARARASIEEAKSLGAEHGVDIEGEIVRARSLGEAIVDLAERSGADLVLLGSAPRWRRQSRFFSPTVDYVLRNAPSQVMVVAYPQGVLED